MPFLFDPAIFDPAIFDTIGAGTMDSSDVDNALLARLAADATLAALLPDGVWFGEAPDGLTAFVLVSLITAIDVPIFQRRAIEDGLYQVTAVGHSARVSSEVIKAAAAQIDAILDPQPPAPPADLVIVGYGVMNLERTERIRVTEIDDLDPAIRWFHRGGRYQLMVAPS